MSLINRIFGASMFALMFVALMMWSGGLSTRSWVDVPITDDLTIGWFHVRPINSNFWNIFNSLNTYFDTIPYNWAKYIRIPMIPLLENATGIQFVLNVLIQFVNGIVTILNIVVGIFNFINESIRVISQFLFAITGFIASNGGTSIAVV